MKKELLYFLYILTIIIFFLFIGNYYFSDTNKKNSYRSTKLYDSEILFFTDNLKILKSDTNNIVEYVENKLNKEKKTYKFWELLTNR